MVQMRMHAKKRRSRDPRLPAYHKALPPPRATTLHHIMAAGYGQLPQTAFPMTTRRDCDAALFLRRRLRFRRMTTPPRSSTAKPSVI